MAPVEKLPSEYSFPLYKTDSIVTVDEPRKASEKVPPDHSRALFKTESIHQIDPALDLSPLRKRSPSQSRRNGSGTEILSSYDPGYSVLCNCGGATTCSRLFCSILFGVFYAFIIWSILEYAFEDSDKAGLENLQSYFALHVIFSALLVVFYLFQSYFVLCNALETLREVEGLHQDILMLCVTYCEIGHDAQNWFFHCIRRYLLGSAWAAFADINTEINAICESTIKKMLTAEESNCLVSLPNARGYNCSLVLLQMLSTHINDGAHYFKESRPDFCSQVFLEIRKLRSGYKKCIAIDEDRGGFTLAYVHFLYLNNFLLLIPAPFALYEPMGAWMIWGVLVLWILFIAALDVAQTLNLPFNSTINVEVSLREMSKIWDILVCGNVNMQNVSERPRRDTDRLENIWRISNLSKKSISTSGFDLSNSSEAQVHTPRAAKTQEL